MRESDQEIFVIYGDYEPLNLEENANTELSANTKLPNANSKIPEGNQKNHRVSLFELVVVSSTEYYVDVDPYAIAG